MTVDETLHLALRDKLIDLASRPPTPRSLLELERTARLVREILIVGQDPKALPPHLWDSTSADAGFGGLGGNTLYQPAGMQLPSPAPATETFGATIIRELMAFLGSTKNSPLAPIPNSLLAPPPPPPPPEPPAPVYDVVLTTPGTTKIQVIKAIRDITGMGLKEAKDLVECCPKVIKKDVPEADAHEMKTRLVDAGASVYLLKVGANPSIPTMSTNGVSA